MKTFILEDYFTKLGFFLTQSYGVNAAYYAQFNLLFHEGCDFGNNDKKVIIKSPLSGIVILDDDDGRGNYGNNVKIWDDKQLCAIQISHMDFNKVSQGQRIKAGDDIGEMGATGNSTGEHVHFNFFITDANGNRLYNMKNQNWGYLDPQHPLDPNPPKKLTGVEDYQVKWIAPIINSDQNTMQISNELYAKLVGGSTVRKEVAEYLEIPDPDNASKDSIIKVIAGYKSTATDRQNQINELKVSLAKETSERQNREEQVSRLKTQLTDMEKTHSEQIDTLQKTIDALTSGDGSWKGKYEDTLKKYDEAMKDKGTISNELAETKQKLENCQKGNPSGPTLWDVIKDFLSKFRMTS